MNLYSYIMSNGGRIVIFNNRLLSEAEDFLYGITSKTAIVADTECSGVRELLLKVTNAKIFKLDFSVST